MGYTLTDSQRETLEFVQKRFRAAEVVHKRYENAWNHYYSLFRSYRNDRDRFNWNKPRDVYPATHELEDKWGAQMFIPYVFSTVETVLPRLLSNHPKMLILPLEDGIEEQVKNMKALIDQQQSQEGIELKFQRAAKNGLIYGLGIGKSTWRKMPGQRTIIRERSIPIPKLSKYVTKTVNAPRFDDAWFESVEPWDFYWDPMATDIESCEFCIHRTWRSHDYVLDRIMDGIWQINPDDVEEQSGKRFYEESHAERWRYAGMDQSSARSDIHEIWEYWDRVQQRVITVLDRQVPVNDMSNPFNHRDLPFQIYRPTVVDGEFVGIGEVEPIEDLQHEMNSMRRQIRDNATLAVQKWGFYSQGLFDEDDIEIGPGKFNAVPGNPSEAVFLPNVGDLPGAPIQEARQIGDDINMTSGLSDAIRGADVAPSTTATATQLVQAAASARIQLKTRRLEAELIKPAARQRLLLNQQFIMEQGQKPVLIPQAVEPGQMEPKFEHARLGPIELQGDMYIEPEGGSTQPENVPQDRQDAQSLWNMFRDNPAVDQRMLARYSLQKMGIKMADAWLTPQPAIPPQVLDNLAAAGVPKDLIDTALGMAKRQTSPEQQQAPQQPQPEPAMNGAQ